MKTDTVQSNIAIRWTDQIDSVGRLLQYCHLPDKNSHIILKDIGNFLPFSEHLFMPWFVTEHPVMFSRTLARKLYPNQLHMSDLLLCCCLAPVNALWYATAVSAAKDLWCLILSDFSVHFLFVHGSVFFKIVMINKFHIVCFKKNPVADEQFHYCWSKCYARHFLLQHGYSRVIVTLCFWPIVFIKL